MFVQVVTDASSRVIENLVDLKPKTKYILAIDESKSTLMEIVKVNETAAHVG